MCESLGIPRILQVTDSETYVSIVFKDLSIWDNIKGEKVIFLEKTFSSIKEEGLG